MLRILALLTISAAILGATLANGQTPDRCTKEHFGYFFLRNFANQTGGPVMEREFFALSNDRLVQIQVLSTLGYRGNGVFDFTTSSGSAETIAVVPGTTIIKEVNSFRARITATSPNTYFNGCYRFI